jgi:CDP-ribitol ribitolphosphotransferase / teichoic acid ribitol-phosphate polymerase
MLADGPVVALDGSSAATGRQATEPPSASATPAVEVVSLHWERIQLVLRLRSTDPHRHASAVMLEHSDPTISEPMVPTWVGTDGDAVVARFNVTLGPGQMPLRAGRWDPTVGGAALAPLSDEVYGTLAQHAREFAYRGGGRYRVTPLIDDEEGTLVLQIGGRRPGRSRSWRKRATKWFRRWVWPRTRVFDMLFGAYRATTTRTGRRVLFTSDSHSDLVGNLAIVHVRMVERGLDREYELMTLFKPHIGRRRSWRDRFRLPRVLAQADVILLDDYQPVIYRLPPDPDQRIVQLWHASGAFKTVGYSRIGKPGGPSPYSRNHKNYTHAIVNGQHDVPFYAEAFGLPEDRVLPIGIPRMDRFFDPAQRAAGREMALREFPAIEGRSVMLFAPTFRGGGPRSAYYDYDRIDWSALHALCVAKDAVTIVKMHPYVREAPPIPRRLRDRIIDGSRAAIDVNDLLFSVDLLITDYSSIVFEFSILQRPMLFYAYDLEEYVEGRGFYVPFEEFVPGRIVRDFSELEDAIRRDAYEVEKVAAFARTHFDHFDGRATDRIIDQLILAR